ncbi:MBL fold metallo-hydrolase [Ruania alba]|uniref:Glyoxylase, beta-lactamase superfamily II n=1 Tax=Ruania alba TaxID=648782 RepID=A0A1H5GAL8_9MICO|nr:MBL fold metallo-hydrolase [Ruania alba]SEE12767.1 Glyoxylase, beta-lactamase superfamily II [Ruania alba]
MADGVPSVSEAEVTEVAPGVFRVRDTCHVYVIRAEGSDPGHRTGIAIDFGSGRVLDLLDELGLDAITDVLMTHHHRDQAQGLPRAVEAGIAVHVPPVEAELFSDVEAMWAAREVGNNYNLRTDRFSLLESVPITSTVPEYRSANYGGIEVRTLPTPGHTPGSVTYLLQKGRRLAFTGDLLYAPGKVWSLLSTQWSYTENEGPTMAVLACDILAAEEPDVLLPSHGEVMDPGAAALKLTGDRLLEYVNQRRPEPTRIREKLADPYRNLTEHLLVNESSESRSYVLISETGAALVMDYGYDMTTGLPPGHERAARRPWLASLPGLKAHHPVTHVEVALPTHYHDDHVAGLNLLREVEGTQVWSPANVAPILADPARYDLPCLWHDPIPSDRELPIGEAFTWHEYEITVHELPGHTLFAAAFEFAVDGVRVLVTGDQQDGQGVPGKTRETRNYQYHNRFRITDYRDSAALYQRVEPGLMITGHWQERWVTDDYLQMLADEAEELVQIHHDLLPLEDLDTGADGVFARIEPYRSTVSSGGTVAYQVWVRNPLREPATALVTPVLPDGWTAVGPDQVTLEPGGTARVPFTVTAAGPPRRRGRIAVDLTVGDLRLGQHAEALIDVHT